MDTVNTVTCLAFVVPVRGKCNLVNVLSYRYCRTKNNKFNLWEQSDNHVFTLLENVQKSDWSQNYPFEIATDRTTVIDILMQCTRHKTQE